jgi:AraC family transcriptional regulator
MFVPAGRTFFGAQRPRLLTRAICLYIDPHTVLVDPDFRFAEAELQPRLLFEDAGLWATVRKLKAQIGSADPAARLHAEALGGLLSIELLRLLQDGAPASRPSPRGGLAVWQQKRVMDFIEEHLSEDVSLDVLADLVRLSPYHFLRSFKQSFGEPPYRYWTGRRIERAKALLTSEIECHEFGASDVGLGSADYGNRSDGPLGTSRHRGGDYDHVFSTSTGGPCNNRATAGQRDYRGEQGLLRKVGPEVKDS